MHSALYDVPHLNIIVSGVKRIWILHIYNRYHFLTNKVCSPFWSSLMSQSRQSGMLKVSLLGSVRQKLTCSSWPRYIPIMYPQNKDDVLNYTSEQGRRNSDYLGNNCTVLPVSICIFNNTFALLYFHQTHWLHGRNNYTEHAFSNIKFRLEFWLARNIAYHQPEAICKQAHLVIQGQEIILVFLITLASLEICKLYILSS